MNVKISGDNLKSLCKLIRYDILTSTTEAQHLFNGRVATLPHTACATARVTYLSLEFTAHSIGGALR